MYSIVVMADSDGVVVNNVPIDDVAVLNDSL